MVIPAAGVAVVVVALLIALEPQQVRHPAAHVVQPLALRHLPEREMTPTLGSYRMLANRSLDVLDQELTSEAQTGVAGAPIYKVSNLSRAMAAD